MKVSFWSEKKDAKEIHIQTRQKQRPVNLTLNFKLVFQVGCYWFCLWEKDSHISMHTCCGDLNTTLLTCRGSRKSFFLLTRNHREGYQRSLGSLVGWFSTFNVYMHTPDSYTYTLNKVNITCPQQTLLIFVFSFFYMSFTTQQKQKNSGKFLSRGFFCLLFSFFGVDTKNKTWCFLWKEKKRQEMLGFSLSKPNKKKIE